MNQWCKYETASPMQTYIPNSLGMSITFDNDTDDYIFVMFPDFNHLEEFEPREKKYFNRDVDEEILFYISPPSARIYSIARYVNNVVIRKAGELYQPAFFFSTRKFIG
jgi:hypothetical protein